MSNQTADGPRTASNSKSGNRNNRPLRSKRDQLIRILSTRRGAEADTISGKFGWQPHTTRAALSGLRKAGFVIRTEKSADGKLTRYRIAATMDQNAQADAE